MEQHLNEPVAARLCRFCAGWILILATASATAQEYSALWGQNGDLWTTNSVLRDFTDVGYLNGDVAIPDWPVGVNVTNFGAVANDAIDDSQAFIDAIAACPSNHAVFVPNGRYQITDQIRVERDYVVLRGEDMYQTVLFFPKNMGERYPKTDFGDSVAKGAFFHVDGGTHRSIENLTMEFREQTKMGHWEWRGAYAMRYQNDVEDSWIRNMYFKNVDEGIQFNRAERVSVINIIFDNSIGRYDFIGSGSSFRWVGHAGIRMTTTRCLFHNIDFRGTYFHDFDIINVPSDCVVSRVTGTNMALHNHGQGANHNLYTEVYAGTGSRILSLSPYQNFETLWNIDADIPIHPGQFTNSFENGNVLVGIGADFPTTITATNHYEDIDPAQLTPSNLYLAQLAFRGKPLPEGPPPSPPLPPALTGDVRILNPIDDISGAGGNPDATTLLFSGYMKFDLSGLQDLSTVAHARLRVCTRARKAGTTFTLSVASVADDSWTQDTITADPAVGSTLDSMLIEDETIHRWLEFDVTSFVQNEWSGDQVVSLYLSNNKPGSFVGSFASREIGNAPQLVIERVADPVPGPPAAPTRVQTTSRNGHILLDWDDAPESDFAHYNVYRTPDPNASHPIAQDLVISDFTDISDQENRAICEMSSNTVFRYTVTAVDKHGYESAPTGFFGTTLHASNNPPAFTTDPILLPHAGEDGAYSENLVSSVTDPESDELYFFKVSGPDWLNVAPDGTLSGTPQPGDAGLNRFTIQVNAVGGRDQAELEILVDTDQSAPAAPTGLAAFAEDGAVRLDWDDNSEADLAGYSLYRSTTSGSYGSALVTNLTASAYHDNTVSNGTTYYYVVTAADSNGNLSAESTEVSATPEDGLILYTTFLGSDVSGAANNWISTADNWDNGLPVELPGIISTNAGYDSNVSHDGYRILHTNGTISRASGFAGLSIRAGSVWVMDGANARLTQTRGLSLNDSQFTVHQGTVNLTDNNRDTTVSGTSVLTLNGGSMSVGRDLLLNGGDLTLNGGSLDIGSAFANSSSGGAGSLVTFNGGTTTVGANSTLTLSKGIRFELGGTTAGTVTIDGTLSGLASMDWLAGSLMSITLSGSDEWAEAEWNADRLTYNGQTKSVLNKTWADVTAVDGLDAGARFDYDSATETLSLATDVVLSGYEQWAAGWDVNIGAATNDYDFDGLKNLLEYGLNGNPTNAMDQGTPPVFSQSGGSYVYVHPQRSDDAHLTYTVETTTHLASGTWTNEGYTVTGTNVTGGTLDFVTNDVETVVDERYIRLKIEP